jgi:quercetin dioxygenase-like cupin family protein
VWIPPGEEHWHGAERESYLLHTAVSLGETEWLEPVSDEDYEG